METFIPATPTVYIRVDRGASRMRDLHDQLNTEALAFKEEWPYIPHLTIAKMPGEQPARDALRVACERWSHNAGSRCILLEKLIFVREQAPNCWQDVAPVQLGRTLVSR
jgi:hypothetical protein